MTELLLGDLVDLGHLEHRVLLEDQGYHEDQIFRRNHLLREVPEID